MRLIILLLSFGTLLNSACVTPPNIPGCRRLESRVITTHDDFGIPKHRIEPNPVCMKQIGEPACGFCAWSTSEKTRFIGEQEKNRLNGHPWSDILKDAVVVPIESWVEVKKYIIENCKKNQECAANISQWRIKLDSLDSAGAIFPNKP